MCESSTDVCVVDESNSGPRYESQQNSEGKSETNVADNKSFDSKHDSESQLRTTERTSNLFLGYLCSVALIGVEGAKAVQVGSDFSAFRQLGISQIGLGYLWLAGPLTAIFVQPVIGIASDSHVSRWGRRRPFIVIGAILTAIGLFGFGFVTGMDSESVALSLAMLFSWLLQAAINCMQAPLRMLLVDAVESNGLDYGNASFAFNHGIGGTIGYLLGGVCVSTGLPFFKTEASAIFSIMVIIVIVTVSITVSMVNEQESLPDPKDHRNIFQAILDGINDLYNTCRTLPMVFWWTFVIQCTVYFAWFTAFVYSALWMGETVYGGEANYDDLSINGCAGNPSAFEEGVQAAKWGFCFMSLLSLLWAPILPKLCSMVGLKLVWITHILILAILLGIMPIVKEGDNHLGVALISLLGFPLAATFSLPWQIVTTVCSGVGDMRERGKTTTLFNLSQCVPEIVAAIFTAPFVFSMGGKPSTGLVLGGIVALVGAVVCIVRLVPDDIHPYKLARSHTNVTPYRH